MITFNTVVAFAILILVLTIVAKGVRIVKQSECMIIERLGRFRTVLNSGFNIIIPVVDSPRDLFWIRANTIRLTDAIDLRETVLDIPEQAVITRDNVSINIDALLYLQIMDPQKAAYEISNLPVAVTQLAQTSLRNVIGEMDLDSTLSSRDIINTKLKDILDEATDKWGTKVNRVELKNISPPMEIQNAMEKQMQAERERRAKVLEAEGDKQARIQRSEGQRQEEINLASGEKDAKILNAEGEANAIIKVAQAKKEAIVKIRESFGGDEHLTAKYLIATNYLDSFDKFGQKPGDKVFVPYEASTALASFGSIKDMLTGGSAK
ncbi:SPFH/Band 7/PHB domain protein [bacterium]|nr:SPFH/Band 7/PHB domain protein [bacterium]